MNSRSTLFKFTLVILVLFLLGMQFLAMMQSDRLYQRINYLIKVIESGRTFQGGNIPQTAGTQNKFPGDQGDWLVWSLSAEPRTLNPVSDESDMSTRYIVSRNVFETLYYYDSDYEGVKLQPVLADGDMDISEDGLEITIKLKDNIWFSDGHEITTDDVIFTYNTIQDPNIDAAAIRNYYNNFDKIVKIDDKTFQFVLKEVHWKTLESVGVFEVLPEHIYKYDDPQQFNSNRTNPVGSGPYIFDKWDVGQQVVLARNENYWGKKTNLDKYVYRFITNSTAALQSLKSGNIDMLEPSSEQFYEVSNDESFTEKFYTKSYWQPSGGFNYIGWNQQREIFKDKAVRQALAHTLDRQSIVDNLLKGYGKVITGPFYVNGKQTNPDVEPWPYDPQKAREILDQAGWKDQNLDGIREKNGITLDFKLIYPGGNSSAERIVKLFKDQAAAVGINIQPEPVEWSIFITRLKKKNFDAALSGWGGTIESDPYQLFHSSQIDGGSNYYGFNNEQADKLIEQARKTLDPETRYDLYHQFHEIVHQEQPYLFLFTRPTYLVLDNRFQNVEIHALGVEYYEWYVPTQLQKY